MSYPPCRYARRWPELWAQLPTDNDRRILSQNLASGRLDGQEPSRACCRVPASRELATAYSRPLFACGGLLIAHSGRHACANAVEVPPSD